MRAILASGGGTLQLGPPVLSRGAIVLAIALGLIALLSAITVVQRIVHVKRQLDAAQQENQ